MGAILGKEWGGAYFGGKQILDINGEWKPFNLQINGFYFAKALVKKDTQAKTISFLVCGDYNISPFVFPSGIFYSDPSIKSYKVSSNTIYGQFAYSSSYSGGNIIYIQLTSNNNGTLSFTSYGDYSDTSYMASGSSYYGYISMTLNYEPV